MFELNITKTKAILNIMFDTEGNGCRSAVDIASNTIFEYFYWLNVNGFKERMLFESANSVADAIKKWKSFKFDTLPGTYEKYLLLSSIFSCPAEKLVYIDGLSDDKLPDFSMGVDFVDYRHEGEICLPRIIVKIQKNRGEKACPHYKMYWEKEYGIRVEHYKSVPSGIPLMESISDFLKSRGLPWDDGLFNRLKSAVFNLQNRKRPSSFDTLVILAKVIDMEVRELYRPINDKHSICMVNIKNNNEKLQKRLAKVQTTDAIRNYAEKYITSSKLSLVSGGEDYLIVKKGRLYGILVFAGVSLLFSGCNYEFACWNGSNPIVVENNFLKELELSQMQTIMIDENAVIEEDYAVQKKCSYQNMAMSTVRPVVTENEVGFLIKYVFMQVEKNKILDRYQIKEIPGKVVIHDRQKKKTEIAEVVPGIGKEKMLRLFCNGKPQYGIVDENTFIFPEYDGKIKHSEKIFTVYKDGKYGFTDSYGNKLNKRDYDYASVESEGLIMVRLNGKCGFVNANDDVEIELAYAEAEDFHEGYAAVRVGDKIGYIDLDGNMRIDAVFDEGYRFSENLAVVGMNGKYGYINKDGKIIVEPKYDGATSCRNGISEVLTEGKVEIIKWGI